MNNMDDVRPEVEEWAKSFDGLEFEEYSQKMRDHIISTQNFDKKSLQFFNDSYDYMARLVKQNKQFEPKLFTSYLTDVKGYTVTFEEFIRMMMLMSLCGFSYENIE